MSNQKSFYIDFLKVLIKELLVHRVLVTVIFACTLLSVVIVGLLYPLKFVTSTTIHADQQNIIAPLLAGSAEMTSVQDQSRVVREVIHSPRILSRVIKELNLAAPDTPPKALELLQNELRSSLMVQNVGPGFIKITMRGPDPSKIFNVASKATELFIRDASESKRSESREAFLFIDNQVKTYKGQLQEAEGKLKAFKSGNIDGTEADVKRRISQLRADIESKELDLEDAIIRVASIEAQLSQESRYVARQFRADGHRERLSAAQSQLSALSLSYTETYPDIVALKQQISDLVKSIEEVENVDSVTPSGNGSTVDANVNSLHEELRSDLGEAKVSVNTIKRRLRLTQELLEEEYERLKRIAEQDAELAELTRDSDVTRDIYEDMLDRKEKARLSMTLDIEGQGVNYKVQEPAAYPLNPTGPRFLHFVLLAPILAVLFPIGLIGVYVQLDPRIRMLDKLEKEISIPIMGVVPHVPTKLSKRVFKVDIVLLALFLLIVLAVFVGILVLRIKGVV